jgi:hypothetical protein
VLLLHAGAGQYVADTVFLRVVRSLEAFADMALLLADDVRGTRWLSARLHDRD